MGIPAGSTKIVLSGLLAGGEIWNTGFWVKGPTLTSAECASAASSLYTIFATTTGTTTMAALKTKFMPSTTSFTTLTIYNYADTSGIATTSGQFIGTPVAGSSVSKNIDQCCIVVTLRTALSGSRHRGRMYFPATGGNLDANSLFASVDAQALVSGLANDFHAVMAEAHFAGFPVSVISRVLSTGFPVTTLTADMRPDIQRRRANRQNRGSLVTATV